MTTDICYALQNPYKMFSIDPQVEKVEMFIRHWSPIAIVEVAMEMGPRIVCYREGTEKSRYAFFDG